MKRIRIHNDITIDWSIITNKEPLSLEGRDLRVSLKSSYDTQQVDFYVEGNVITIYFLGGEQRTLGVYSVILQETTDGIMRTLDECKAFELVPHSCMEGGEDEGSIHTSHIKLESSITIGTPGKPGLTPEEHEALIKATEDANIAAGKATEAANNADLAREQLTTTFNEKVAALEADYAQKKASLEADYNTTKSNLASDYSKTKEDLEAEYRSKAAALEADYSNVKAGLNSDYEAKKHALELDYTATKNSLSSDYEATKSALDADYSTKKAALDADYAGKIQSLQQAFNNAIANLNERMAAIEAQYVTDRGEWQAQVNAMLLKFEQDFATAEAAREARVSQAIAQANAAATNANQKAIEAGNVNAVLDGTNLTITDRNGHSVTSNVKGDKGDKGDSVTMFPNVTIFGQPTIQESQISGFSVRDYLQFPFIVDFAGRHWQIDCAFTTGADVSQQHNIFDSQFGLAFAFSGGKFVMALSTNGTSWNLGAPSGTHSILPSTTYYVRISWDGVRYVLAYSTDKETYIEDIVVVSSETLFSRQIIIGKDLANLHPFNGSINMSDCRLTISGKVVWEGMDDAGLATRMAIDLSNIDAAGKQKLNEVAMAGEVGQKIGDLSSDVANGVHVGAVSGLALNLMPKANTTAQEFVRQITGGSYAASVWDGGVAKIERVKGNTIVVDGQLINMRAEGVRSYGMNLWNEQWEIGAYRTSDGVKMSDTGCIRSKNTCSLMDNKKIYIYQGHNYKVRFLYYDKDGVFISSPSSVTNEEVIVPIGAAYFTFYLRVSPTIYEHDICVSASGSMNGQYTPYIESSDRKWTETLNRIFPDGMKSNGEVYDEFTSTKAIQRIAADGSVLAEPIETEYDELNLTYTAHKNGMEEAIVPEGVESTPLNADITYGVDAYGAIINLLDRVAELEGNTAAIASAITAAQSLSLTSKDGE